MANPCGQTNKPAPMAFLGSPVAMSSSTIGAISEFSQLLASQRLIAQTSLWGPISMPALELQGPPSIVLA